MWLEAIFEELFVRKERSEINPHKGGKKNEFVVMENLLWCRGERPPSPNTLLKCCSSP